jgi:carboxypeptidase family protein
MTVTFSCGRIAVLAMALLGAESGNALAQRATGVFRGTVTRDSSRVPLEGIEVSVEGVGTSRSSSQGKFTFPSLAPGLYTVKLRGPGYTPIEGDIRIAEGETKDLTFAIWPVRVELPKVEVKGEAAALNIGLAEFERRRAYGLGKFITPADFKGRENATLTDVLRSNVQGLLFVHMPNGGTAIAGKRAIVTSFQPRGKCNPSDVFCTPLEDACYMQLWVDGQRMYTYHPPGPTSPLPPNTDEYPTSNIVGVEVYRGPAETPLQFSTPGAQCGTVVIWTGRHP